MKAYQIKITIKDSHPPIWRRFIVPAGLSFSQLSVVMNEIMGWSGYHLFSFEFPGSHVCVEEIMDEFDDFGFDSFDRIEASETMIEPYLDREKKFRYTYDFGDDWIHECVVEKVMEDYENAYPVVLKFKGDTPYEDCGGIYGYYELLEILDNPDDPQYEEMKEWTEESSDIAYDLQGVNEKLKKFKLTNKKGKPMDLVQIYEEILNKGQGFRQIQGDTRYLSDYDFDEFDEPDDEDDFMDGALTQFDAMMREMEAEFKKIMEMSPRFSLHDGTVKLTDIYEDYTKAILTDIVKLHGLKGYSKYNKKELAEFLAREVLDRDVMCRYFTFLEDEELDILKKFSALSEERMPTEEDIQNARSLVEGGYCGAAGMWGIVVPREVYEAYKENCDSEWRKERRKALELSCYLNAAAELYGVCTMDRVLDIYRKHTGNKVNEMSIYSFCEMIPHTKKNYYFDGEKLIYGTLRDKAEIAELLNAQGDVPFYMPTKKEAETLGKEGYLPFDSYMKALSNLLYMNFEEMGGDADELCKYVQCLIRGGASVNEVMEKLEEYLWFDDDKALKKKVREAVTKVWKHTRMTALRGNMPAGSSPEEQPEASAPFDRSAGDNTGNTGDNILSFPVDVKKKIYPNDPCPCGSGKKYKKCCGRNINK